MREVLELRSSGWVPRRKKPEAMKIDEFRAKEEPMKAQFRSLLSVSAESPLSSTGTPRQATPASVSSGSRPAGPASTRTPRHMDRYARAQTSQLSSPVVTDQDLAKRYETAKPTSAAAAGKKWGEAEARPDPSKPALPDSDIKAGVDSMVREFLSIHDIAEVLTCMEELSQDDNAFRNVTVVSSLLMHAMEENEAPGRARAASLITRLLQEYKLLSTDDVDNGISDILAALPDIIDDLPIAPKRLGEVLHILISDGSLSSEFIARSDDALTEKVFAFAR